MKHIIGSIQLSCEGRLQRDIRYDNEIYLFFKSPQNLLEVGDLRLLADADAQRVTCLEGLEGDSAADEAGSTGDEDKSGRHFVGGCGLNKEVVGMKKRERDVDQEAVLVNIQLDNLAVISNHFTIINA